MAGQFHPDLLGDAGVGQCRIKTMSQGMERAFGEFLYPFPWNDHRVQASLLYNGQEHFREPAPAGGYFARQFGAQVAVRTKCG